MWSRRRRDALGVKRHHLITRRAIVDRYSVRQSPLPSVNVIVRAFFTGTTSLTY